MLFTTDSNFKQAQLYYNSLAAHEKAHLISAISFELSHCDDPIVYESYTKLLTNIDFKLAKDVAVQVGGIVPESARPNAGKSSVALSQTYYAPKEPTIASRRIAILIADGFAATEVQAVRAALASASALSFIIGPRRGKIMSASSPGMTLTADHHFEGQRSTLFDAVFVPSGGEHAKALLANGRVVHWIREAFGHCKAIGAVGDGKSISIHHFLAS
jgi:catalase